MLVLAVLVHLGRTQSLDDAVRQWARPDDVWGPLQVRVDLIVEGLRPAVTLPVTACVAAVVSVARRSARPLLLAAATTILMAGLTVGVKILLHRPDPHGALSDHGGSFPSGHTATVVACAGFATMLLGPAQRWSWWLATLLLGTLMAAALIVQAAHWATDVVGGGLVGVTVLAVLSALGLDRWGAPAPSHPDVIRPGPRAEEA